MPAPAELQHLIEHRRAIGADTYDEVWDGEYHVAPEAHFFHGYLDGEVAADETWLPTAALVVEILSSTLLGVVVADVAAAITWPRQVGC